MVLSELGSRISGALMNMQKQDVIDEKVIGVMLKEIGNALIASDVDFKLVLKLNKNIKERIQIQTLAAGVNKRKVVHSAVFDELCALMDSGRKPYVPKKGKPNVIMFVGLQGSGKTTTVTKLAYHYKKKGWKTGLVCADTFRAGAFDQLKQNATKARVPFYGSYTETDPVVVASDGVKHFKEKEFEIIIVDTSGRHKQEEALFEEMTQVAEACDPDQTVFLMDGNIGQAAFDQAKAFKDQVTVGAVVLTKMDAGGKGGGALSAVAATESPVIFIGTGEHLEDFEVFDTKPFVSKLLGMGDIGGLVNKLKEIVPEGKEEDMMERLGKGQFSLRDLYEQFQYILKMGPISQVMDMIPGMSQMMKQLGGAGGDSNAKLKSFMTIMDSMTDQELDDSKLLTANKLTRESRINRISRGSGRSNREVGELLTQFKMMSGAIGKMGKMKMPKGGQMNQRSMAQMAQMVPSHLLKQMGGMGGLQNMMKSMQGGGGAGGMGM
eukprot:TRINITY_DN122_c0_g1_i1.p1 TRINITY_DN122_c0_g1~~TRINITY_DN122_c0_g1_i1.p1  ORF type:complete len:493 (-),score=165.18 TRINITY_DN122_c0_g1_i1:41-1519(-)